MRARARAANLRQAGFVLIYTLWIVAAASVALAVLAKYASQPARVSERQFAAAIELHESVNVLDYVLAHAMSQEREIDPRFITYRQEIQTDTAQAGRSRVRELKEILSQIGMNLNIPDDSEAGIAVVKGTQETREQVDAGPVKVRQGKIFGASKVDKTVRLGKTSYEVQVRPANAGPNLNTLGREPMARYLVQLGLAEAAAKHLAAVVHDWVDFDDFLSEDGAESSQYPFQHGPRNGPLQTWDEVYYLKGANAELVEFLRQHFTLHSRAERVNAGYFDAELLATLTDLEPWQAKVALENHALPKADQVALSELIGDEEARRFDARASWDSDTEILLVDVRGAGRHVSAVLDTSTQQLLDWYLAR